METSRGSEQSEEAFSPVLRPMVTECDAAYGRHIASLLCYIATSWVAPPQKERLPSSSKDFLATMLFDHKGQAIRSYVSEKKRLQRQLCRLPHNGFGGKVATRSHSLTGRSPEVLSCCIYAALFTIARRIQERLPADVRRRSTDCFQRWLLARWTSAPSGAATDICLMAPRPRRTSDQLNRIVLTTMLATLEETLCRAEAIGHSSRREIDYTLARNLLVRRIRLERNRWTKREKICISYNHYLWYE